MTTADALPDLRENPFFSCLSEVESKSLLRASRERIFLKNERIFGEESAASAVWLLRSGQVKMVGLNRSGRETILEILVPGELFGGAVSLQDANPATSIAMLPATAFEIPRAAWADCLRRNPDAAARILRIVGRRTRLALLALSVSTEHVECRIAAVLLRLSEKNGEELTRGRRLGILLTRRDLAEMAGTTVETAIRVMSRWRRKGLAGADSRGRVVLLDVPAIKALVAGRASSERIRESTGPRPFSGMRPRGKAAFTSRP